MDTLRQQVVNRMSRLGETEMATEIMAAWLAGSYNTPDIATLTEGQFKTMLEVAYATYHTTTRSQVAAAALLDAGAAATLRL